MSLKHCILGLLALRPYTGYDLKATFDRSVSYVWNASGSQIYATLRELERHGLVQAELVVQESRPNKKIYSITPKGSEELHRWLLEPVPEKFSKDEFLVKIFFANEVDDAIASKHLQQYVEQLEAQLASMEMVWNKVVSRPSRNPRARHYQLLVLDLKITTTKAALAEAARILVEHMSWSERQEKGRLQAVGTS